jgi:hypothetical protein
MAKAKLAIVLGAVARESKPNPATSDLVGAYNEARTRIRQPRAVDPAGIPYLIYIRRIEEAFGDLPLDRT